MAGPVGVDEFARLCKKLVSVGTKVVTLGLNQIGRHTSRPAGMRERTHKQQGS